MSETPELTSIVVAGGGTAGHISPMLAVARAFQARYPQARVTVIGTEHGLETSLVPQAGFELKTIERVPMPRRPSLGALRFPARFRKAIAQAKSIISSSGAQAVFGVGGYVCTPVYIAARQLGIPVIIHEANVRPGLANKLGARHAAALGTAFTATRIKKAIHVGMPMRREISGLNRFQARPAARTRLGLAEDQPTLIVTGGSSGAVRLNTAVMDAVPALSARGIQILHITGKDKQLKNADGTLFAHPGYQQLEYVSDMQDVYAAADLLLCRSGAGTVCEVAAVGLPSVFVPLPVGNGEQALNAGELVEAKAALLVPDAELNREYLLHTVAELVLDQDRLTQMSEAALAHGIRDADEKVVDLILEASAV